MHAQHHSPLHSFSQTLHCPQSLPHARSAVLHLAQIIDQEASMTPHCHHTNLARNCAAIVLFVRSAVLCLAQIIDSVVHLTLDGVNGK
jgi:hypothetical protein